MPDSLMIDVSELRLKWAVEDVTLAAQKLIDLMEKQGNLAMIEATSDYLNKVHTYVQILGENHEV